MCIQSLYPHAVPSFVHTLLTLKHVIPYTSTYLYIHINPSTHMLHMHTVRTACVLTYTRQCVHIYMHFILCNIRLYINICGYMRVYMYIHMYAYE